MYLVLVKGLNENLDLIESPLRHYCMQKQKDR